MPTLTTTGMYKGVVKRDGKAKERERWMLGIGNGTLTLGLVTWGSGTWLAGDTLLEYRVSTVQM